MKFNQFYLTYAWSKWMYFVFAMGKVLFSRNVKKNSHRYNLSDYLVHLTFQFCWLTWVRLDIFIKYCILGHIVPHPADTIQKFCQARDQFTILNEIVRHNYIINRNIWIISTTDLQMGFMAHIKAKQTSLTQFVSNSIRGISVFVYR